MAKYGWRDPRRTGPADRYATVFGLAVTCAYVHIWGLRIDPRGQVLDTEDAEIPGLYAAGELVGGLYYHNYPGGSGLASGAVLGKVAGTSAAEDALD